MFGVSKTLAYSLLDRLTGGRGIERSVNGELIRFPARWFRYYEADYEAGTLDFIRAQIKPGDVVLDCGAHFGLFSVSMARIVGAGGKVYSFEPTPDTRAILGETIALNGLSSVVRIRPEAISDASGHAEFFRTPDHGSNANSLVSGERAREGISVPTITIDDFAAREGIKPRLIKIDVEGAEQNALLGAIRTLEETRPSLSVGIHPDALRRAGGSLSEVWQILHQHEYAVRHDRMVVDEKWFVAQTSLFDIQALPREI